MKMRRVLGFLLICICSLSNAQKVEKGGTFDIPLSRVVAGSPHLTNIDKNHFLKNDGGKLFFLKTQPHKIKDLVGAKDFKKFPYLIVVVDSEGEKAVQGISLKKGDVNFDFVKVLRNDNEICVIGKKESITTKGFEVCLFRLDKQTLKIIESEIVISDGEYTSLTDKYYNQLFVRYSANKKRILIASRRFRSLKEGHYIQDVVVVNESFKVEKKINIKQKQLFVDDVIVSDEGDFYAVGAYFVGEKKGGKLFFYKFNDNGTVGKCTFQVKSGEVLHINQDIKVDALSNWADASYGALQIINGVLYYDVPYISLSTEGDAGVYSFKLSRNNFTTPTVNKVKYSNALMSGVLSVYSYNDIRKLLPNKMKSVIMDDGSRIIVGDYSLMYYSGQAGMKYKGRNLTVVKLSIDNELVWDKLIPRETLSASVDKWIEVEVCKGRNGVNIFLNDDESNNLLSSRVPVDKNRKLEDCVLKQLYINSEGDIKQYKLSQVTSSYRVKKLSLVKDAIYLEGQIIIVDSPYYLKNPEINFYKFK